MVKKSILCDKMCPRLFYVVHKLILNKILLVLSQENKQSARTSGTLAMSQIVWEPKFFLPIILTETCLLSNAPVSLTKMISTWDLTCAMLYIVQCSTYYYEAYSIRLYTFQSYTIYEWSLNASTLCTNFKITTHSGKGTSR